MPTVPNSISHFVASGLSIFSFRVKCCVPLSVSCPTGLVSRCPVPSTQCPSSRPSLTELVRWSFMVISFRFRPACPGRADNSGLPVD